MSCKCRAVSVDGGLSYLRRTFDDRRDYEDISIKWPDDLGTKAIAAINDAISRGCNARGILCAVAICLRDNGYAIQ